MRHIFTQIKVNAVLVLVLFFLLNALTVSSQNIPNGYYSTADGKTGFELKTALHNIIKDHSVKSYSSLWSHFESTDKKENGKIWDMYSNCDWTFGSSQQDN